MTEMVFKGRKMVTHHATNHDFDQILSPPSLLSKPGVQRGSTTGEAGINNAILVVSAVVPDRFWTNLIKME